MPLDLAERTAQGLARSGTRLVLVAGSGEPLLHPDWFEILSMFRRAGLEVELTTNGTLIDEAAASRLVESGIRSVAVSIWAISADAFAILCPGTDLKFLERKIEGLRLLAQAKARSGAKRPMIKLKSTVNRYNYQSLGEMIHLAKDLGLDGVSFGPYWDWSGEFESAALAPEETRGLLPQLAEWADLASGLGLYHNLNGLMARIRSGPTEYEDRPCYAAWFHANIRFDGIVNPCTQGVRTIGDLKQQSWAEIWNSSQYLAYRRQAARVAGLHGLDAHCDCTWCGHWHGNRQVHRWFRPIVPLLGRA
jgi:MoaA/NifB/PqqE/SkfB family radical SAM enzyme